MMHCGRCGCQMHRGECPKHTGELPRGCPEGIPTEVFQCRLLSDQNMMLRHQTELLEFIAGFIQAGADQAQVAAAAANINRAAEKKSTASGIILTP